MTHNGNLSRVLGFDTLTERKSVPPLNSDGETKEDSLKTRMLTVLALLVMLSSPSPAAHRHPQIMAAISALETAKAHLQAAAHDFGGHRVDAIRAIDGALYQLNICMQY